MKMACGDEVVEPTGDDGTEIVPLVAELGVAIPVPVEATTGAEYDGIPAPTGVTTALAAGALTAGTDALTARVEAADEAGQ